MLPNLVDRGKMGGHFFYNLVRLHMAPSCFLLSDTNDSKSSLYVGEISTLECLNHFDSDARVVLVEFGANGGKTGWVSRDEMPAGASVSEWRRLISVEDIELIDFKVDIGATSLSTHDDGEAHLLFEHEHLALAFVELLMGHSEALKLVPLLVSNKGCYISCKAGVDTRIFPTFEAYLAGVWRQA